MVEIVDSTRDAMKTEHIAVAEVVTKSHQRIDQSEVIGLGNDLDDPLVGIPQRINGCGRFTRAAQRLGQRQSTEFKMVATQSFGKRTAKSSFERRKILLSCRGYAGLLSVPLPKIAVGCDHCTVPRASLIPVFELDLGKCRFCWRLLS